LTDAAGLPVSLVIDRANRHDMKLARATVEAIVIPRPEPTPEQPQKSKGMIMTKSVIWRRLSVIRRIAEHALKKLSTQDINSSAHNFSERTIANP
jgi:hypothetical protein